jgi:TolB-like protein/DNA-binding winged helix-turn-helix (wHTH) protein
MLATQEAVFRFGDVEVREREFRLIKAGEAVPVEPKAFRVLLILLRNPQKLITKEELLDAVWGDTAVTENSLTRSIALLRKLLGERPHSNRYIETIATVGYRWACEVEVSEKAYRERKAIEEPKDLSGTGKADVRRKRWWASVLAGSSLLALCLAGTVWWVARRASIRAREVTTASIAVLPFNDLSPNHDQDYFSDGLTEELLNQLTKIPNLKVAGRRSALQFKGKNEDLRIIGQKLNVTNVLEGSIQREGSRIRIIAQLVKADDGFNLWSESYDNDLKDIFALQDNIARAVALALQLKLRAGGSSATVPPRGTTKIEAYEAFLHARYFAHMNDKNSQERALAYANSGIQLDPGYAPTYALRASIVVQAGGMLWMDPSVAAKKARGDAEKAIALDPNLADGYRVLSYIQAEPELNCREAEISLRRARELAPGDTDNLVRSGMLAMCQGRQEQAVELLQNALLLDPLRPLEYMNLAQNLRDLGRYEEAHATIGKALDLNPNQIMIHEILGEVYLAQGRPHEALAEMEKEPADWLRDLGKALAYNALGRRQESDEALARLISQHQNDCAYQIAQVYAYRGEADQAFAWLNRAYGQRDPGFEWFKTDLKLKSLREDPRYAQLLRKLNLPV